MKRILRSLAVFAFPIVAACVTNTPPVEVPGEHDSGAAVADADRRDAAPEAARADADAAGAGDVVISADTTRNSDSADVGSEVASTREIDLVFMIDNSPSMAPKVAKLNAQFPKMIAALKDPVDGTLPDLRIAFIDSDLGTKGAYQNGSCGPKTLSDGTTSSYGDMGRFQMVQASSCGVTSAEALWLETSKNQAVNYTGDIGQVFGCLAKNLGTLGCGMEQQLQAYQFALVMNGISNEEQRKMLRTNAYLGLVFLSDEDDCSAALNDGMFGDKAELRGEAASLRCATRGHACGGRSLASSPPGFPADARFTAPFADCQARTDACPNQLDGSGSTDTSQPTDCSPLGSIKTMADGIKKLKGDPGKQVLVAGIFGWPLADADMPSAEYKIAPIPNPNTADTQHPTVYDYWPVCYDPDHRPSEATTDLATGFDSAAAGWGATGGLRLSAFVDEFGVNGSKFSICQADFSAALQSIGTKLGSRLAK
jgi:hypothetical protein